MTVVQDYFRVSAAQSKVEIAKKGVSQGEDFFKLTGQLEKGGEVAHSDAIRAEFPILSRQVHGRPLVYLDNAASAQKPEAVIEAMAGQMRTAYANVHRGLHALANATTEAFENARAASANRSEVNSAAPRLVYPLALGRMSIDWR